MSSSHGVTKFIGDFEEPSKLLRALVDRIRLGNATLVLGAGICAPLGLPDWTKLVHRMFEARGLPMPQQPPERAAELLLADHLSGDRSQLLLLAKQSLYSSLDLSIWMLRQNRTLSAIATLARTASDVSQLTVTTFNYDNLLELYLRGHGVRAESVLHPVSAASGARVLVLHPHGLLGFGHSSEDSKSIVLDRLSISAAGVGDGNGWDFVLRERWRSRFCVFVGLSGDDNHFDTLLAQCKEEHALLKNGWPCWGVRLVAGLNSSELALQRKLWGLRGIATCHLDNYDVALPDFLLSVCRDVSASA